MDSETGTEAALLNEVVSLLSEVVRTVDPEIIAGTRVLQSSYFKGMGAAQLSSIRQRLSSYTDAEKRATMNLLLVAEHEANQWYSNWIKGGADSNLSHHTVHKGVFVARSMLALEVPIQEPNRVSRFINTLFGSPADETAEAFIGRFIIEEVTGSKDLSADTHHLVWVAEREERLLPFVEHFRAIGSMDRNVCDSVLDGASALHTGAL